MYRVYWIAWGVLLALTTTMVALDQAGLPRGALLAVVLSAMLTDCKRDTDTAPASSCEHADAKVYLSDTLEPESDM